VNDPRRNLLLIIIAIVCFLLALASFQDADGEVLLTAGSWLALGLASFAASHIP